MDPIAFFDHLAATSQSSNEEDLMQTTYRAPVAVEKQQQDNNKQLLNSRSLETIKPPKKEEDDEGEETDVFAAQNNQKSFSFKWHELVASYRLEKEGKKSKLDIVYIPTCYVNIALSQHLKDQLIGLEEVEEHFDKANIDLHSKIENSYHQLSMNIKDHQQHIHDEKQLFQKEQAIIKGTHRRDICI